VFLYLLFLSLLGRGKMPEFTAEYSTAIPAGGQVMAMDRWDNYAAMVTSLNWFGSKVREQLVAT